MTQHSSPQAPLGRGSDVASRATYPRPSKWPALLPSKAFSWTPRHQLALHVRRKWQKGLRGQPGGPERQDQGGQACTHPQKITLVGEKKKVAKLICRTGNCLGAPPGIPVTYRLAWGQPAPQSVNNSASTSKGDQGQQQEESSGFTEQPEDSPGSQGHRVSGEALPRGTYVTAGPHRCLGSQPSPLGRSHPTDLPEGHCSSLACGHVFTKLVLSRASQSREPGLRAGHTPTTPPCPGCLVKLHWPNSTGGS